MTKESFVYVTYIVSTPEKVFEAITKPDLARRYWGHENVSDWKPGSKWEHVRANDTRAVELVGKVIEVSPPTRLVITWANASQADDPASHSRVTFEIEEYDDMVRLTVTHDELEAGSGMAKGISKGWPVVLSSLKSFLETGRAIKQITFPVSGHGPVGGLGGPVGDQQLRWDVGAAAALVGQPSRFAQRPPGAQATGQLAAQLAPSLHVEGLVDGLVGHLHLRVVGELRAQCATDLFGTPPLLQPGSDRGVQPRVAAQLPRLRAAGGLLGLGLGHRRPVPQLHMLEAFVRAGPTGNRAQSVALPVRARFGPGPAHDLVADQFAADRGPMPAESPRDLGLAQPLGPALGDLLPLGQRQIPPRRLGKIRDHPASLSDPPPTPAHRHADPRRRVLDRRPTHPRPPERPHPLPRKPRTTSHHHHPRSDRVLRPLLESAGPKNRTSEPKCSSAGLKSAVRSQSAVLRVAGARSSGGGGRGR